jgi:hypothetical protein
MVDSLKYFLIGFCRDSGGDAESINSVVCACRLPVGRIVPDLMEMEKSLCAYKDTKKVIILAISQVDKKFYNDFSNRMNK